MHQLAASTAYTRPAVTSNPTPYAAHLGQHSLQCSGVFPPSNQQVHEAGHLLAIVVAHMRAWSVGGLGRRQELRHNGRHWQERTLQKRSKNRPKTCQTASPFWHGGRRHPPTFASSCPRLVRQSVSVSSLAATSQRSTSTSPASGSSNCGGTGQGHRAHVSEHLWQAGGWVCRTG